MTTAVSQVSEMCARHLHNMIVKEDAFDKGDLSVAIEKGYMALDTWLLRCLRLNEPPPLVSIPTSTPYHSTLPLQRGRSDRTGEIPRGERS